MSLVLEPRLLPGLAAIWRRCAAGFGDDGSPQDARSSRRIAFKLFAGIALLGAFWGSVIAVAGLNALYLCVALIGCAFILLDFRVGVVLLILLMPISNSDVFPHAMFGITGLNRSEEHTSELQSRRDLVCRLLLEKKKKKKKTYIFSKQKKINTKHT